MPEEGSPIDSLAGAIADKQPIDWRVAAGTGTQSADRGLVAQFEIIAAIAADARSGGLSGRTRSRPRSLGILYAAIVALAAAKATVGVLATGPLHAVGTGIEGPSLLNVALFGVSGLILVLGGAQDRRGRSLGAVFIFIAAAFADPLSWDATGGALAWWAEALRAAPPEAFFALAFWVFVSMFPREPVRHVERVLSTGFIVASAAVGAVLFGANAALAASQSGLLRPSFVPWLRVFDRHAPVLAFWPLLLGLAVCAIPYLIWKSRFEAIDEKRRVTWFVAALAAGIAPMLLAVVASPVVPLFADPARRRVVGWFLYAALASVVPSTAYAVVVHRVMAVHLILRRTLQHTLARYAVWLASVGPPAYVLVQMYLHRDLTVTELLSRGRWIGLLFLPLLGLGALTFRQQLLAWVDRWFFRESIDSAEVLARLDRGFRAAQSIREIAGLLTQEVDRAIHPKAVAVLIVDDDASQLVSLSEKVPPLSTRSTLVDLLRSARTEIELDAREDGPVGRLLPAFDRQWLEAGGFQLLSPLIGSTGTLLGVLALSESRSQLPYTKKDRIIIAAMNGHAAMRLENQCLRERPAGGLGAARRPPFEAVDWQDEPGVRCPACSRVWPVATHVCPCGRDTVPAALPVVVQGKFRVERLIGAGGMGVVYLAVDTALHRRVAIKTLPALTPERATRLQREARAMASVLHPNLAMIFGLETWRETPLLIVEYLEGGTLADRLRDGPLPVPIVIDLGVVLADVLDRVHGSGILHRDIKPSNIGYTREGLPKLLDFGLAAMLERSGDADGAWAAIPAADASPDLEWAAATTTMTTTLQIVGTPLYLSPEAVAGVPPQASFDLWSLCLVLYEAVAGRLPFTGLPTREVLASIPRLGVPDVREYRRECLPDVAALFARTLAPDPAVRPQTAGELRNLLQRLRADLRSSESN